MRLLFLIGVITWHVAAEDFTAAYRYPNTFDDVTYELNQYSIAILKVAVRNDVENRVLSPIGAALLMPQAALGAMGKTRRELNNSLPLPPYNSYAQGVIHDLVRSFAHYYDDNTSVQMFVANQMFIADFLMAIPEFSQKVWNLFETQPRPMRLANTFTTAIAMNEWSSASTKGRIRDGVIPEELRNDADLILVGTAYFNGYWENPFQVSQTTLMPFWIDGLNAQPIPTMSNVGYYRGGNIISLNAQFIELPYKNQMMGNGLSMIIIRPIQRQGLGRLVDNLHFVQINELRSRETQYIHVTLPKFKIQTSIDLSKPFGQFGVNEMFGRYPDFRNIANEPIKVVQAIQKVVVEVDEGNPESAAVLALIDDVFTVTPYNYNGAEKFFVDCPFVVMIVNKDGLILFNGIVTSPDYRRSSSEDTQEYPMKYN